ncbi:MAG: hypothetical protein KJ042_00025 [Deltaproteobacteria bacterium]|nr:hypothetical protein [Deltaproteobacteria bacterium]
MRFAVVFFIAVIVSTPGCGGGDSSDDDSPDADDDADDDTVDDDQANDDQNDDDANDDDAVDDDIGDPFEGIVPTTLDKTIVPTESGDTWALGEGPGEPHIERNDLGTVPTRDPSGAEPLSISYFLSIADSQIVDEESPTRLTFFDAWWVLFGMFEYVFRPQEDLTAQQFNAIVRTANRIQTDYDRDFDLALVLGDGADNAQRNELELMIDILDGSGLVSGAPGWARPDSGDLDINPDTGRNRGERHFGAQETDADGNNINHFQRAGFPSSNADFRAPGLRRANGEPLPWHFAIGNHDVLNNGGFTPGGRLGYFSAAEYVGTRSRFGFIPGVGALAQYLIDNPDATVNTWGGLYGIPVNWRSILWLMTFDPEWTNDIDPRFDVDLYTAGTPEDPTDDGVDVAADSAREFLGPEGVIPLFAKRGHGFADNNGDDVVDAEDGGWYRVDLGGDVPLRVLVLDTMDAAIVSEGGMSIRQLEWLRDELDTAEVDDVLVVVASHHPADLMLVGTQRMSDVLHAHPNVILHLVGHGHVNDVTAYPKPGGDPGAGYWEVQTPSICSFPQQARIFEIVDNRDGTGTVYSTLFDHYPIDGDNADILAQKGRELGFENYLQLGYDGGGFHGYGGVNERNVALKFQIPSDVADALDSIPSSGEITSTDVLGHLID